MRLVVLGIVFCWLTGCLGYETKEYSFKLNKDGHSGAAVIRYYEIYSRTGSGDESESDWKVLNDEYLNGDRLNEGFMKVRNIKKRLYVEDGKLNGEMTFEFDSLSHAGIYRFDANTFIKYIDPKEELFTGGNGRSGGDILPVVFWNKSEMTLKIVPTSASDTAGVKISLISRYKKSISNVK